MPVPRKTFSLIPILVLAASSSAARADSPAADLADDIKAERWIDCLMHYKSALRNGAKDDDLKDLAATCLAKAKASPSAKDDWAQRISTMGGVVRGQIDDLANGQSTDYKTLTKAVNACNDAIALAVTVVDPSTPITVSDYGQPDWKGTIAGAKTWCDQAAKGADQAKQKLLGPYEKAGLKGDKLQLVADHLDVEFNVPGGETTSEPKKLAAASVLFLAWTGSQTCTNGEPWRLERFQFDKAQKLVKTTDKEYCGDPPKSAYR
jgi:hypothetical protein